MDQLQELVSKWADMTQNGSIKIRMRRDWTMIDLMDGARVVHEIDHDTFAAAVGEALERLGL